MRINWLQFAGHLNFYILDKKTLTVVVVVVFVYSDVSIKSEDFFFSIESGFTWEKSRIYYVIANEENDCA